MPQLKSLEKILVEKLASSVSTGALGVGVVVILLGFALLLPSVVLFEVVELILALILLIYGELFCGGFDLFNITKAIIPTIIKDMRIKKK